MSEIDGMLKTQFLALYYVLRGALRHVEIILGMEAKTPNRDEARALGWLRQHNVSVSEVIEREKDRLGQCRKLT